ncbi:ribulose bisphosphate carboxylase small subunit, chloroplastic-like [Diospyros lotus]|uniref:ribulose bisphosphate carboxylase small subunit, chloroplastic-like n=1 Tax=Diospyros lotus TaxID=55363 RepID=UPI002257211D|nr:ribulose bisphosphate carboxylase small subunit, chloroplastic-like [Diospyros lotus]
MASSMISTAAVASLNRASPAQATMVAPFTGLKSSSALPATRKLDNDITSLASNGGRVQCMKGGFVYRENNRSPGYYDGRYWTMWKLPMFGCTDSGQVLKEVEEAKKEYKDAYIRIIGFDNVRQVQCISFIVYKPPEF